MARHSIRMNASVFVVILSMTLFPLTEGGTISVSSASDEEDSYCGAQQPSRASQRLREVLDSIEQESNCKDCALRRANLTQEEFKLLRFEIVKLQILQRLQRSRPPCIRTPRPALQPILEAADMDNSTGDNDEEDDEDKERTKSYVVFPNEEEQLSCLEPCTYPCSHITFQLPQELENKIPTSAEVWVYKRNQKEVLKLTQLVFHPDTESLLNQTDLAIEAATTDSRLVKFSLPNATTWWEGNEFFVLDFQISCHSGCSGVNNMPAISPDGQEKPFLIVKSKSDKGSPRNRRSIDCVEGSTLCCKERLYMSFAEIGWDDWIIAPDGYEANYCRGKCFNDVGSSRYYHSSLLHRYMAIKGRDIVPDDIGLKMCCTPSKMSSLSILYKNENDTLVKSDLLNMKVESCDCA